MRTKISNYIFVFLPVICFLTLSFYIGCGSDNSKEYLQSSTVTLEDSAYTGLNPPNNAAYDDVFFQEYGTNPFIDTEDDHLSTFGMDVDTASYSITRRYLNDGNLPPRDAVRVEEFVNTFDYNYKPPSDGAFAVYIEGSPSRFGDGKRLQLMRIGIQGRVIADENRKNAILTFVIDVSGSMALENRVRSGKTVIDTIS